MKTKYYMMIILIMSTLILCAQEKDETSANNLYFGQNRPGLIPEIFAPDVITPKYEVQNCVTFSPDGKEIYWGLWYPDNKINKILYSKLENNKWTQPKFMFTSAKHNYNDDAPFLSPDGKRFYFISRRPSYQGDTSKLETVWVAERENNGWSEPKLLPQTINRMEFHMQFSVAEDYSMYFKSKKGSASKNNDIYYSNYQNGNYQEPIKLDESINTDFGEFTPYISKSKNFLIFARYGMPDGFGGSDLYISFKNENGTWSQSINLGETINSEGWDNCPIISPDEKYLFFASNRSGRNKIYWVDTKIIEELKTGKN